MEYVLVDAAGGNSGKKEYKKTYGEQAILDCGGLDNLRFILKKEKIKIKSDLLKRNLYDYLKENP